MKDFYFDDQHWAIRYVVVDTGNWLAGRLVLISPHAFGSFFEDGDTLLVNLTKEQIANSPSIESHKPVSRQFEDEYYRYYGWPAYYGGSGMLGMGGFPMALPPQYVPVRESPRESGSEFSDDPHLQSTKALDGFHIETPDGAVGHVTDYMIDDKSWAIGHLVVETGHWYAGKEIALSPRDVERISYDDSSIVVTLTKETIKAAPDYQRPQPAYHDSRDFNA